MTKIAINGFGRKSSKGFTLIELLVVIAIIGLLASIVLVSLNTARVKARDTRRKTDLKQIQLTLEMYYDANGAYPTLIWPTWTVSNNAANWNAFTSALSAYISKVPVDPVNTSGQGPWVDNIYTYAYRSNGTIYDLIGQFENKTDTDRCAAKCWKYHTAGELPYCLPATPYSCPGGYSYSVYLFADH